MNSLLSCAIGAALKAGDVIIDIYNSENFGTQIKDDSSPLTLADIASNNIITEHLAVTGIPILSEEGKSIPYDQRKEYPLIWIVDPIDGTKEFIKRNGEFTVNIALVENGIAQLGVIYVPVLKELYFASSEVGAWKGTNIESFTSLDKILMKSEKLPLSSANNAAYTVVASRSHLTKETQEYIEQLKEHYAEIKLISKGSSLKLCLVAEGTADCYPRFAPTMEWDIAAGHAICKHSGIEVLDLETNEEMRYNRAELRNNWFVVKR